MNNLNPTQKGVYLRAALYVFIAMAGVIVSDATWREWIGQHAIAVFGVLLAGATAFRAFIDNSPAQQKMDEAMKAASSGESGAVNDALTVGSAVIGTVGTAAVNAAEEKAADVVDDIQEAVSDGIQSAGTRILGNVISRLPKP